MNYNPLTERFNFKLHFLFPFLYTLLILLLTAAFLQAAESYYPALKTGLLSYGLLFLFFLQGLFSSYLKKESELPRYLTFLEMVFFWALLKMLYCRFPFAWNSLFTRPPLEFWAVFLAGTLGWLRIVRISSLLYLFGVDYRVIAVEGGRESWGIEQYRSLSYPPVWQALRKEITLLNLCLIITWAAEGSPGPGLVFLSACFLLIQFTLLCLLYREKKLLDWLLEGLESPARTGTLWVKTLLIVLLLLMLISALLPVNYSLLTLEDINRWLNSLLPTDPALPGVELPPEKGQPSLPEKLQELSGGGESSPWLKYLLILLLIITGISVIGIAAGFFLSLLYSDLKKTAALPRLLIDFYLLLRQVIRGILSGFRQQVIHYQGWLTNKSGRALTRLTSSAVGDDEPGRQGLPSGVREMIFFLYRALLRYTENRVGRKEPGETPYEYSRRLRSKLPSLSGEIERITELFVEAVYSQHTFGENLAAVLIRLWQNLRQKLNSL